MLPPPVSGTSTKTVIIEAQPATGTPMRKYNTAKIFWLRSLQFHLDPLIGCQKFLQNPDVS
jgi:hypothetical protein